MSYTRINRRERATRIGAVVVGSTLALTMSLFGLIALLTGDAAGTLDRLPLYVLGMAAAFVGSVVTLDDFLLDGETVLAWSVGLAVLTFVFVGLGSEGLVYSIRYPGQVVSSQLFVYVLSAGLAATGLGYWVARYRDDLSKGTKRGL